MQVTVFMYQCLGRYLWYLSAAKDIYSCDNKGTFR